MHFSTILLTVLSLATLGSGGQVNFYADLNCQDYIGSRYPGVGRITGGPSGSFSAIWVTADQSTCSRTCGPTIICGDYQCNTRKAALLWPSPNGCISFSTGVWAKNECGYHQCANV
ncbi:hypothetical protein QBC38DRAFT_497728 [Podospora fimiseda]|uniref:Uncharacterized protein n=1 Tax=Podospora fimiseda TaxID=252190 RepID=A0AAN7BTI8_9PEZI|nr:hypothetical protein QBC38DRAFT_497728 [Podospora fimiseda]